MNKNAIKKFAIEARKKLIASVSDRAGMLGITAEGCSEPISKGIDFEVYKTVAGTEVTLGRTQCEQRRKLKEQINARGFEAVVEEVAYTWFNRICAIRFMEVNDYLPTRVRVLSSEKEGKNEPDIVTQAPDVDLDFTDKEREYILDCKMNNKLDELFKMLFIKQCNKLSEILPKLFEATEDYTEMLLNISYTNKDDIIHMLVNQETGIPEADFNVSTIGEDGQPTGQVEIIGWLYQYYNTELKDDTFAQLKKNVKISKERIPAATQLFTPDWIVRYMVENSVGRLWIEHLRAVDSTVNEKEVAEGFGWKYYLPEAEQEAEVNVKLAEIRTSYKDLKPEDITCIDPCMGSGHILVAMFDVLMDIYKSAGYSERDAAFEIVEHNIHGLDIDKRAYQLAYFAVMMKGRGYNRRFFHGKDDVTPQPNVFAIRESNYFNREHLKYFGSSIESGEREEIFKECVEVIDAMTDAREYGSSLVINEREWDKLFAFADEYLIDEQFSIETYGIENTRNLLLEIIECAKQISNRYDAVVTNPPYMGSGGMSTKLSSYVKENYPLSKNDMFSVFIEKCGSLSKHNGFYGMITQPSIISLTSYEKLREKILSQNMVISLLHMGRGIFGIDFGSTCFVFRRCSINNYYGGYFKLFERTFQYIDPVDISKLYLEAKKNINFEYDFSSYVAKYGVEDNYAEDIMEDELSGSTVKLYFTKRQNEFEKIPGKPLSFWISEQAIACFDSIDKLGECAAPKQGLATTDNNRFVRFWYEVAFDNIGFSMSAEEAKESGKKWFPFNKGGDYRKWYGNNETVVNYQYDGKEIKDNVLKKYTYLKTPDFVVKNQGYYFKENGTWSAISSGNISVRYSPKGYVISNAGMAVYDEIRLKYIIAFLNSSCVSELFIKAINQTLNYNAGDIEKLPIIFSNKYYDEVVSLAEKCINLVRNEWDSHEQSWDYKKHPLLKYGESKIIDSMKKLQRETEDAYDELKKAEERINKIFIEIYGLEGEVNYEVKDKYISIKITNKKESIIELISYFVGCLFGRYSLYEDGLLRIDAELDKINTIYDVDNIVPITDEEYFSDDIVGKFCEWLKEAYGEDTLEENLDYVAQVLGNKGVSSREVIRNYFENDFILEHIKVYQKRPIYWMFDSGKANGFKALMYMHRYNSDTVGKVRVDYLHNVQKSIEQAKISAEYLRDNGSGAEKAKATKQITKYTKQLAEIQIYDEAMAHIASQRIEIDLDDGVKVNYEKFQGVEVAQEGKKALKVDLLAKIK